MSGLGRARNAALGLVLWTACSSSIMRVGSQYAKSGVIGPDGGTLTVTASEDPAIAGTSITVPRGALSALTTIEIGETFNQPVVASGALGPVIDFEKTSGTAFAKPVTLTIPLELPAGFDASRVGVMALEADGTSYDITAVTVSNGMVTFQVSGFTDFGAHDEGEPDAGCSPNCDSDAACGSSDGCGGICDANCDDAGCTPRCAGDAACGSSDGCGGTCEANCKDAGCTPSCGGDAGCGSSDGCGGTCDANCHLDGGTDGGKGCGAGAACGLDLPNCCGSSCVNLHTDATNCGSCGHACEAPARDCTQGVCSCPDSGTLCGQPDAGAPLFCANATDDDLNCGHCGNVCADTFAANSSCRYGGCMCNTSLEFLCGAPGSRGATCISNTNKTACDSGICYRNCTTDAGCDYICDGGNH